MDEAAAQLRNAINLALSLDQSNSNDNNTNEQRQNNNNNNRNDELSHHNGNIGGSSEGTYISSLSGSTLPSERSNALVASRRKSYYAANSNHNNNVMMDDNDNNRHGSNERHEWQRRRIHAATRVENAVSNYELALFNYHHHQQQQQQQQNDNNINDSNINEQGDVVDLLVALLTSVPRNLLQQFSEEKKTTVVGYNNHTHHHHQQQQQQKDDEDEEEYLSSMEQICFNIACISSDIIQKYFMNANSIPKINSNMELQLPLLQDRDVYELVDEVVQICNVNNNTDQTSVIGGLCLATIEQIIRLLNTLSEGRDVERAIYERTHGNHDNNWDDEDIMSIFSCVPSKESIRLVHTLMYRYLCDLEDPNMDASSNVGYFVSYLLEHFAKIIREEMGYNSFDECRTTSLFDSWADGVDEHMVQRLNDEEVKDVYTLLVRYHVASIQSTMQLIDNAESVIRTTIAESETEGGVDGSALKGLVVILQDTIRHVTMVATTTEVIDNLSFDYDPEIRAIFYPLISSYARFTVSSLHNAILLLRGACDNANEVEDMAILADDLLYRLCRVSIGIEYLKYPSIKGGDGEEVLAMSLLRAMNSQLITGKARFLLDIASNRVQKAEKGNGSNNNGEPSLKRQRFSSSLLSGQLSQPPPDMYSMSDNSSSEERRGEIMDILLACLALSHSNQDSECPDSTVVKQASCITSALVFSQDVTSTDGNKQREITPIDPLNPWHTLQVKPMQKLAAAFESLTNDEETPDRSVLAYALSTPHLLDTNNL